MSQLPQPRASLSGLARLGLFLQLVLVARGCLRVRLRPALDTSSQARFLLWRDGSSRTRLFKRWPCLVRSRAVVQGSCVANFSHGPFSVLLRFSDTRVMTRLRSGINSNPDGQVGAATGLCGQPCEMSRPDLFMAHFLSSGTISPRFW